MPYETLIVAYDSEDRADAAVHAIRALGIPRNDIRRHPVSAKGIEEVAAAPEAAPASRGFWNWLFGDDLQARTLETYEHALERGGTILSVQVMAEEVERVRQVLDDFGPLDLKETRAEL